ncbi:hypothetical protein NOR_03968 [Metarhizium rileyi]|uniref:Uncharacterized protein n=1 Tax=Metarhizium rileyi (strain RCEF 4871) TaxID=1649241 RepID=A0A162LT85_METRR|nr:hypothetical protein NOR_03968 [Metarhizium rileyi RCEF 4871]
MAQTDMAMTSADMAPTDTTMQISPPATMSPSSPPARRVANRAATPLGLFLEGSGFGKRNNTKVPATTGSLDPYASMSPAKTPDMDLAAVLPAPVNTGGGSGVADSVPCADREQQQRRLGPSLRAIVNSGFGSGFDSGPASASSLGSSIHRCSPVAPIRRPLTLAPAATDPRAPLGQMAKSTPPPDPDPEPTSFLELGHDARPLRTASVRADTYIAHPKPIAHPSVVSHGVSEKLIRSGSAAGNIAQLEATAERLSMTSSIDDAIRDLHGALKRSDSRRSAKLALATMASVDENTTSPTGHLGRHLSAASSIVSTNITARHGGYSPAGFVLSPNTSLTSRLRSGSVNSAGRPDATHDTIPSRHGPGKSSVRSVRSTKLSLAEISESEPISLNQKAFDEADAAPPLEEQSAENLQILEPTVVDMPIVDACHPVLESDLGQPTGPQPAHMQTPPAPLVQEEYRQERRPESIHSNNTSEQARDAFIDFDGVHWEPQNDEDLYPPQDMEPNLPTPRPVPISMARPTSYIDPSTGQNMLYYPARVPAMLNLPPKLSSRPKAADRNHRRSQVLSMMLDVPAQDISTSPQQKRQSTLSDLKGRSAAAQEAPVRDSWLPDPIASHRNSFAALSTFGAMKDGEAQSSQAEEDRPLTSPPEQAAAYEPVSDTLRRPERLSKAMKGNRKSRASMLDTLPPQLRASAFFDLPSVAQEVEIKDGSAMATLDSILDASANAPVSAFTDHVYAGKLGSEVYGKKKKQKARQSGATLNGLAPEPPVKKRSSMMWLGGRNSGHISDEQKRPHSSMAITTPEAARSQDGRLTPRSVDSAEHAIRAVGDESDKDDEGEEEDEAENLGDAYLGPPTTLLAELHLRKQEQKQRVKNMGKCLPNGMYATLLEMDTVAEAQKKNRKNKRVNLAWEDPDAHMDQNGSDDEDVPLAILAAMQRGAKNLADLDRPMGLMERREQEDNEPLSHRRARLQGLEPPPPMNQRLGVMSFSASQALGGQTPDSQLRAVPSPDPELDDVEEETLADRRRRLAIRDGELPRARPVSCAFSAELLSQFGDTENATNGNKSKKDDNKEGQTAGPSGEEETLGQRRRRLQAEREARQQEISRGNLVGNQPSQDTQRRRLSLANVLNAHPKKEAGRRAQEDGIRIEEQRRAAQDRDAKMAALRMQMPSSLPQPGVERSGGFLGGAFNDGTGGGYGLKATLSSPAINTHGLSPGKRSSVVTGYGPGYGAPVAQPAYSAMNGYGQGFGTMNAMNAYNGRPVTHIYGPGMMPLPLNNGSMDRVEQWRNGVRP